MTHEDIDPWNEFLSESSEELQSLQQDGTSSSTAVSTLDTAAPHDEDANTIALPSSRSTELVARPSDVVRVSFADLSMAAPPETEARVEPPRPARMPEPERPRTSHVTSFVPRAESRGSAWPRTEVAAAPPAPVADTVEVPAVEARTPVRPHPSAALVAAGISLKDVLARQTPVHWAEAVATVEDLCVVLAGTNETPQVPDLADILITSDGRVILRPGAAGDPDVATLGRTLHALLSSATTALPLRLFVTSSISSERFKSVALFADALSYYAAPGRTEHIQALYHRAAGSAVAGVPAASVAPPLAPSRPPDKPAAQTSRGRRSNTLAWAFGIFGGVLVGTVSAFWMWPVAPPRELTLQTKGPRAGEAVKPQRQDDWRLGPVPAGRRLKTSVAGASRTPVSTAAKPISPSTTETPGRPAPPQPAIADAAPSRPTALAPLPPSYRSQTLPMTTPESSVTSASAAPAPAIVPVADAGVYTDADREVVPPVLLSKRPSPPPAAEGTDSQVTNTVELVVDPSGRVQAVKMLGRSTRLTDAIPLQEYKLLRFTPAQKDGHPVSFRYLLRTVVAPR